MQVTKGGCVGQTFAQAKLNDSSGGQRSKRRSKEERKGMVETFVKRYQASNNGSFPSLHLTHKEVGGSYYIVREVFRELIQENRVLAPPKLPPGEQNMENLDSFLENYPLGSISFDPNVHGLQPKDNQTLLNEYEFRREKVLNSRRISELHRRSLDNETIISGSTHTTVNNKEYENPRYGESFKGGGGVIDAEASQIPGTDHADTTHAAIADKISEEQMHTESTLSSEVEEPKHTELLTERALEGQKDEVKEVEAYQPQIRPLSEGVVVETFPLRPVSSTIYNVDEKTSEKEVLDAKLEEEVASPKSKLIENLNTQNHLSTDENIVIDVSNITDVKSENTLPAEDKSSNSPRSLGSQNLDSNNSSSSLRQLTFEDTAVNKNKSDIQPSGTAQKQASNRINLGTWEAASSKKSDGQESNPLTSFIKTFVAAFMKFWSE